MTTKCEPITPGKILLKEFMKPLEVSQNKLARELKVPVGRISDIVHGKRGISPDTALRLAAYFKTTPEFWMNLQSRYDLKVVKRVSGPSIFKAIRPIQRKIA